MEKITANKFDLLASDRRRKLLGVLSLYDTGDEVTVRHLARVIRCAEVNTSVDRMKQSEYNSAYNGLIQSHLPKLATAGYIEYDERAKTVTKIEKTDTLVTLMNCH